MDHARRKVAKRIGFAVALAGIAIPISVLPKEIEMTHVLRLSRGSFSPDLLTTVRKRLDDSQESLVPAIRGLPGCLHYWTGIDEAACSMINFSVWTNLKAAQQMDTLEPMIKLGAEFATMGVQFERPIINYNSLWEI